MKPIIEIQNLSKTYKIRHESGSYLTLRDIMSEAIFHPITFLKKRIKKAIGRGEETFWALKDVSFNIEKGEVIGIIGANGAGKSTLLKILSKITPPTQGRVIVRGNIASLLEVGTGFHPELTGRENIFLNGAILGMKRSDTAAKFEDIVEFAGMRQFLDTPVKYYSSGMYVRLAFSVAAHMDPDILIIDEVLAVGDAEFQKKCLEKMEEITQKEGRTILFVSHNLVSVQNLCKKTILLQHGQVKKVGPTKEVIDTYLNQKSLERKSPISHLQGDKRSNVGDVRFTEIQVSNGKPGEPIESGDKLKIVMKYRSDYPDGISDVRIVITIDSERSKQTVLRLDSDVSAKSIGQKIPPEGTIVCETDAINLVEGNYLLHANFHTQGASRDNVQRAAEFHVHTDLKKHAFKIDPDVTVTDRLSSYVFKEV